MHKTNFLNLLKWHANGKGKGKHQFINSRKNIIKTISHADLIKKSLGLSYILLEKGIKKNDICYIISVEQYSQLLFFYAVIAAGAIPMIAPQLPRFGAELEMLAKVQYWKDRYKDKFKVISDYNYRVNDIVIDDFEKIPDSIECADQSLASENDILYLQSSSATTGQPKAIAISHKNIFTNTDQIRQGLAASDNEIFVSWLPLYHDMGLVGAELFSLTYDYDLVLIPPYEFSRYPEVWLEAISLYRGTITAIPSFTIDYILDKADFNSEQHLDLSCLRSICIGAEPIRMESIEKFIAAYKPYRLKSNAFVPCYGLAESTLAATFKTAGEQPKALSVIQSSISHGKKIELSSDDRKDLVRITSVGKPVIGISCFIEHDNKMFKEELICGEICLIGESITQGYMQENNVISSLANKKLMTGDIGFVYKGELYILDRDKNIIILNGVNYVASEIESLVADKLKIEKRHVIVFEEQVNSESKHIVAVVEVRGLDRSAFDNTVAGAICASTIVNEIVFVKRGFIDVTSSGKKRYFMARQKYIKGDFTRITNKKINRIEVSYEK